MIRPMLFVLSMCFLAVFSLQCKKTMSEMTDSVYQDYDHQALGYKFFEPSKKFFLGNDLQEISGLSYYSGNLIAAINDEDGELYFINTNTGKVDRKIKFGKNNDYEGVEIINQRAYILESDGDIHYFKIGDADKTDAKKVDTPLDGNNTEGLAQYKGDLLIFTKENGGYDDHEVDGKAGYRFALKEEKLVKKELMSFGEDDLDDFIEGREYFDGINDFDPSGVAVHPLTNDIYVVSADMAIAVFNPSFELKEVLRLHPNVFNQVEGICFLPDGTMFLSSEGEGGKGKLFKIDYLNK